MPEDFISLAPLQRRRDIGLTVEHVADMRDWPCIENGVDCIAVIGAALVQPLDTDPIRRCVALAGLAMNIHRTTLLVRIWPKSSGSRPCGGTSRYWESLEPRLASYEPSDD